MNKILNRIIFIVVSILILLSIFAYIGNFYNMTISKTTSDWGDFGSYLGGITSPILAFLNVYIFYILTKTATEINRRLTKSQLTHDISKEYQKKIHDLTFEFIDSIANYKIDNNDKSHLVHAENALNKISFFLDSFLKEADVYLNNGTNELRSKSESLQESIDCLIKSNYENEKIMQDFFDKKSEFIQQMFKQINHE